MKIAVAQTKPFKGDIKRNKEAHLKLIKKAVKEGVDAIFFPELSITGYEPELAKLLATTQNNALFDVFQQISDKSSIVIGIGVPTPSKNGICISTVVFQPMKPRVTYSKQHLHISEMPYFVKGNTPLFITLKNQKIALAICYELSVSSHSKCAYANGTSIYVACTVNTFDGVTKDINHLAKIAKNYKLTVLMSNCVGQTGNYNCAGKSSVWNSSGKLVRQLNSINEGVLIYDVENKSSKII